MKKQNLIISVGIGRYAMLLGLLLAVFLFYTPAVRAAVILHAFNWSYEEVGNKAQEIANLGYKKVLVAPPLKSNAGV